MKFFFDFLPLLVFFAAYSFWDIYAATGAAIVATIAQVAWLLARKQPVPRFLWIGLALIVVFGGATILLRDDTFIRWKPTVAYWLFAAVLLVSDLALKKNIVRKLMQENIALNDLIWRRLNLSWAGFFLAMGLLNLYFAYRFSQETWVKFKVFGGIGLMLLFVFAQLLFLSKHIVEKETR